MNKLGIPIIWIEIFLNDKCLTHEKFRSKFIGMYNQENKKNNKQAVTSIEQIKDIISLDFDLNAKKIEIKLHKQNYNAYIKILYNILNGSAYYINKVVCSYMQCSDEVNMVYLPKNIETLRSFNVVMEVQIENYNFDVYYIWEDNEGFISIKNTEDKIINKIEDVTQMLETQEKYLKEYIFINK